MNAPNGPGPDRRGSLTAPAGTAAAAGLTAPDAQAAPAAPGSSLTEAVLAAFQTHRVVAIGDAHASQEVHDLLLTMLSDPRSPTSGRCWTRARCSRAAARATTCCGSPTPRASRPAGWMR